MRIVARLLAAVLLFTGAVLADDYDVHFSPRQGAQEAFAREIKEADETILVAMYSLSLGIAGVEALEERAQAGVKVWVILHQAHGAAKDAAESLERKGIDVRFVRKTMHEKFCLIDDRVLINGSGNWSFGAENRYDESYLIVRDRPGVLKDFEDEFRRLLAESEDFPHPDGKKSAYRPFPRNRIVTGRKKRDDPEAIFTSENKDNKKTGVCAEHIIEQIEKARSSIDIAVAHFNYEEIAKALIAHHEKYNENRKKSDDITIRVLVDLGEYGSRKVSQVIKLEKAGIEVRYKVFSLGFWWPRSQLMHHKFIIIDGKALSFGSYNWSETAEHSNYENVQALSGAHWKPAVQAFEAEFERIWELNREAYDPFVKALHSKKGDKGYRRYLPVHFDTPYWNRPMTLTRNEYKVIRRLTQYGFYYGYRDNVQVGYWDKQKKDPFTGEQLPHAEFVDGWSISPVAFIVHRSSGTIHHGSCKSLPDAENQERYISLEKALAAGEKPHATCMRDEIEGLRD